MTAASSSVPLKSAMPLTGLIYKQMKPVPPPSGDTGCWMKPPAPLLAKNAPKTAVYDQQRCQRLQSKVRKHRQRCQRLHPREKKHQQRCHQFHHNVGEYQQFTAAFRLHHPSSNKGANGCTPERKSTNKGATSFTTTWVSISSSLRPSDSITHPATMVPTVAPQREKAPPKVPPVSPQSKKARQGVRGFNPSGRINTIRRC